MEDMNKIFTHVWNEEPQEWQEKMRERARVAFDLVDPESLKYQGYANYETWAVSLWLNNDQGLYYRVLEMAERAREDGPVSPQALSGVWPPGRASVYLLADEIENMIDSPLGNEASMFSDLLTHALGRVDWQEIAQGVLESLPEEDDESED